ncbi:MAG: cell filamentation protein Fic, partial [Bacteroides sp.]|nr:cell filamentation protein Fic [Bacteroides sp.]
MNNIEVSTHDFWHVGKGTVSHQRAMEKAEQEYRLFQVRELSPVERAYLDTIKALNEKAKGKG